MHFIYFCNIFCTAYIIDIIVADAEVVDLPVLAGVAAAVVVAAAKFLGGCAPGPASVGSVESVAFVGPAELVVAAAAGAGPPAVAEPVAAVAGT